MNHENRVEFIIETLLDAKWVFMTPLTRRSIFNGYYCHMVMFPYPKNERPPTACGSSIDPSYYKKAVSNHKLPVTANYKDICSKCFNEVMHNPERYGWEVTASQEHSLNEKFLFTYIG
jgi:hypothetical protein